MEDKYFDKKIRRLSESAPEFEVDETAFADMKKRLETNAKKSPVALPVWLMYLLPLLFLSAFGYYKYNGLITQLQEVQQALSAVEETSVTHQKIIYQYDTIITTIHKTITVEEYAPVHESARLTNASNALLLQNAQPYFARRFYNAPLMGYTSNTLLNGSLLNDRWFGSGDPVDESKIDGSEKAALAQQLIESPDYLPYPLLGPLAHENTNKINDGLLELDAQGNTSVNPLYYFVPTGYSLSAGASPVISSNLLGVDGAAQYGVYASMDFIGGLSLQLGGEFLRFSIKLEDQGVDGNYPIVPPENPSDVLHEIYGSFKYWQVPVSLKKTFLKDQKTRPYVSAGVVAKRPFKQSFVYEYLDGLGEYKKNLELNQGGIETDNWRLGIGVERTVYKAVSADLNIYYNHSAQQHQGEYNQLKYYGVNLGLKYNLN